MKTITFKITGVGPMLMHSIRLADRRDPITKEIAAINKKRTKRTEDDFDRLQLLEWQGGLWLNADGHPCLPQDAIIACIRAGAKKTKCGNDVLAGIWCDDPAVLSYDGPKDLDELFADSRFVDYRGAGIGQKRIMRTRPKFAAWSATFSLEVDESVASEEDVRSWLVTAGTYCGIGDYRPRFGRFVVE